MKTIIALATIVFATQVFASQLVGIKQLSNQSLSQQVDVIKKSKSFNLSTLKKVAVLKASGATLQTQREKTIEQAAHMLCQFFDDGVGVSLTSNNSAGIAQATKNMEEGSGGFDDESNTVVKALGQIVQIPGIEIYSGTAGGNNTFGVVLGIYDVKNSEIAVFSNTNCGSDD
jgi:hypothetical protein